MSGEPGPLPARVSAAAPGAAVLVHLPRLVAMMAEAAQRYGIIVRDKTLDAIGFYAEDPTPLRTNPYIRLFGGKTPGVLLESFPWKYLQAVQSSLKTGPA